MKLPHYCDVKEKDVDLKRLGSVLWLSQEQEVQGFEDLLLVPGLGPRTLQSLTLVSEVIHGTPSRFADPARFSFAHGGKSANPFAVPTKVYDQTIEQLQVAVEKAKFGDQDKLKAIEKLTKVAQRAEAGFQPNNGFKEYLDNERKNSPKYGGRFVEKREKKKKLGPENQLGLFD